MFIKFYGHKCRLNEAETMQTNLLSSQQLGKHSISKLFNNMQSENAPCLDDYHIISYILFHGSYLHDVHSNLVYLHHNDKVFQYQKLISDQRIYRL